MAFTEIVVDHGGTKTEVTRYAERVIDDHKEQRRAAEAAEQEAAAAAAEELAAGDEAVGAGAAAEAEEEAGGNEALAGVVCQMSQDPDAAAEAEDEDGTPEVTAPSASAPSAAAAAPAADGMNIDFISFVIYNTVKRVCYHYTTTEAVAVEVEEWAEGEGELHFARVTEQTEEALTLEAIKGEQQS